MYLTGGQFKGRKVEVPKSAKPTLSKVRESVFNILNQYEFENNTFLDMFAGSAIMGLEAISRGYIVKEIEINPKTAQIIKKNYENLKLKADITICNALNYIGGKFDIIYLDPPWDSEYQPIIKKAHDLLNEKGVIVVEYDKEKSIYINDILDKLDINLKILKSKKYGRTLIDVIGKC